MISQVVYAFLKNAWNITVAGPGSQPWQAKLPHAQAWLAMGLPLLVVAAVLQVLGSLVLAEQLLPEQGP